MWRSAVRLTLVMWGIIGLLVAIAPMLGRSGGDVIAAINDSAGFFDVVLVDVSRQRMLSLSPNGDDQQFLPAWSPDGTQLAWLNSVGVKMSIHRYDFTQHTLIRHPLPEYTNALYWSPDSKSLVLAMNTPNGLADLVQLRLSDNTLSALTQTREAWERDITFAPDGRRYAYTYPLMSGTSHVVIADSATRRVMWMSEAGATTPSWSPDGRSIAYLSQHSIGFALTVLDVDSESTRTLSTEVSVGAFAVRWSADSTQIAFSTDAWRVGIYRLDTDTLRWVTPNGEADIFPEWSPDSTRLVVTNEAGQLVLIDTTTLVRTPLMAGRLPVWWGVP